MKSILYLALADLANHSNGVSIKVLSQIAAFKQMGLSADCLCYNNGRISLFNNEDSFNDFTLNSIQKKLPRRYAYWKVAKEYLQSRHYEIVYIRYPFFDGFVTGTIKTAKKNSDCKVILEVQTYPLNKEKMVGEKRINYYVDFLFQRSAIKMIDRILYIGDETKKVFGKEAIRIPNGIPDYLKKINTVHHQDNNGTINLVAVSIMTLSHGYDRLINGMREYYSYNPEEKQRVELYLVGEGMCLDYYKSLTKEAKLEDYIHFTGFQEGEELDRTYEIADLGIGCLGLYRNGHQAASALKIKEYMIRGIPFLIAGEEIGVPDNYKYMLNFKNDESSIDVDKIVLFVNEIRKLDSSVVGNEMRSFAMENFQWVNILKSACGDMF